MASRLPASIGAALGIAAARLPNFRRTDGAAREPEGLWKGAALCILIVVLAMRLAAAAVAGLVRDRGMIAFIGFAAAIVLATFAHMSHHAGRTGMNELRPRATSAPVQDQEIAHGAATTNRGPGDIAGFNAWKRGVEQALEAAAVEDPRGSGDGSQPKDLPQGREKAATPFDLGVAREVANVKANALDEKNDSNAASETKQAGGAEAAKEPKPTEEANETEPLSQSALADWGAASTNRLPVATGRRVERPWRRAHVWGRVRWRGRHHGLTYFRLTGVGRAFPFVLSAR